MAVLTATTACADLAAWASGPAGTGLAWMASHPIAYPALEVLHIAGMALLLGSLVVLDVRVWGGATDVPLRPLARLALPITLLGFALVACSGLLMVASQPAELLCNRAFQIKLVLVLLADGMKLPADLAARSVPAQSAPVDGPALLKATQLPTRKDRRWEIELAPLSRVQAWGVPEIKTGQTLALVGFSFSGEKGEAILRAEYLFVGGKAYGMRSSPV